MLQTTGQGIPATALTAVVDSSCESTGMLESIGVSRISVDFGVRRKIYSRANRLMADFDGFPLFFYGFDLTVC